VAGAAIAGEAFAVSAVRALIRASCCCSAPRLSEVIVPANRSELRTASFKDSSSGLCRCSEDWSNLSVSAMVVVDVAVETYPGHCWQYSVSNDAPTRRDT
jgi:hypothetical protein